MIRSLTLAYGMAAAFWLGRTLDTAVEMVVAAGAVALAFEAVRRVFLKPAVTFMRKVDVAIEILRKLPAWQECIDRRLDRLEGIHDADLAVKHEVRSRRP